MKNNIIISALILCSFALGFTLNGFMIYKSIVGNMTSEVRVEKAQTNN